MSRIRFTLTTALVLVLSAAAITSQAQPPAGGGGGRGQRGGGGGPGGWGGGPGGNLVQLATNDAVATELKLTDRQKDKVKQLSEDQNKRRGEAFQQLRQQADQFRAQAAQQAQAQALQPQQIDPSVDARGSGAGNSLAGALNSRGYQGPTFGGRFAGGQVDPGQQQAAAQVQGRRAGNAAQAQAFQVMREAMQGLQNQFDGELARVLDKGQFKRLKEVQLQVQGPSAVLREDVAERLELTDEQQGEIRQTLNEANQAQRELMRTNFQFIRSQMPNPPTNGNAAAGGNGNAAAGTQANPNAATAPGQGQQNGQAQGGQGGRRNRGNGGGGPNGNNGQNNRPQFDREAMQKVMEQPEVKAKMEETRKAQSQLRTQEYAAVYKSMDRRQVSLFKKLLGKPFDVDSITAGFMRGGPGGPGGRRNGANGNGNGNTNQAATPSTAKAAPAASSSSTGTSTTGTAPATSRRPSLRERRGLGGQSSPDGDSPQ